MQSGTDVNQSGLSVFAAALIMVVTLLHTASAQTLSAKDALTEECKRQSVKTTLVCTNVKDPKLKAECEKDAKEYPVEFQQQVSGGKFKKHQPDCKLGKELKKYFAACRDECGERGINIIPTVAAEASKSLRKCGTIANKGYTAVCRDKIAAKNTSKQSDVASYYSCRRGVSTCWGGDGSRTEKNRLRDGDIAVPANSGYKYGDKITVRGPNGNTEVLTVRDILGFGNEKTGAKFDVFIEPGRMTTAFERLGLSRRNGIGNLEVVEVFRPTATAAK